MVGDMVYERALETPENIFFINFEKPDTKGFVLMLDRRLRIIDNSTLALEKLRMANKDKFYNWSSKKMKKHLVD